MIKKDNIYLGIAIGFIVPVASYALFYFADSMFHINHRASGNQVIKDTTLHLMALCLDLLLIRLYSTKWNFDQSSKGIMISIMLLALLIVIVNYKSFIE
ncbi:MAG: hypothetical protein WCK02_09875 [Bacteroidota bacterium]